MSAIRGLALGEVVCSLRQQWLGVLAGGVGGVKSYKPGQVVVG
jgi:hypothetical protein